MKKIAITSFVDKDDKFVNEANQMTLSGKDLSSKFEFVIFSHPEITNKIKQRHNVKVYSYLPSEDQYYESYKFAKSLEFLKSNENILNDYSHVIKTDTDVFFTKYLNEHIFTDNILFNKGYYSMNEVCAEQTYQLAKMFGYSNYKRNFQPCSTFLGPTKDIINLMHLSNILCKEIFFYLCPDGDYQKQIADTWGKSLYSGTSTMIATEIVMSSIFNSEMLEYSEKFDANSFSEEDVSGIYHIHQWHGSGIFSKLEAISGAYDQKIALNNNTISDYCLSIFLENKNG